MSKTAVVLNYTPEQVSFMKATYKPAASQVERDAAVMAIMEKVGKNIQSVRSKLVNMKVYVKATTVSSVTGGVAAKKDAMAETLVNVAGVNVDSEGKESRPNADSIAKMNKTDIQFFTTKILDLQTGLEAAYKDLDGETEEKGDDSE